MVRDRELPHIPDQSNLSNGIAMTNKVDRQSAVEGAQNWARTLAPYRKPHIARSITEIAITFVPFVVLWVLAWAALSVSYWLSLAIAVPTAAFLVRLFMIQHDCGHGAFFTHRAANDWVGRVIGVLTLTPYDFWRRTHAIHHATAGNLEHRGMGDIETMTADEYLALPRWRRLAYRLYRHPIVLFGLGPAYLFLLQQRLPWGLMRNGLLPWLSTMGTNAAIAAVVALFMWLVGVGPFLLVHGPVTLMAASLGVWLFYVQHQFEDTRWDRDRDWNFSTSALHGSSYYVLPGFLHWLTANIGVHHVHHLCSRIPYYRLQRVLKDHPELARIGRLTLLDSFKTVDLALWDESRRQLISFKALRKRLAAPADRPLAVKDISAPELRTAE
jgi:omega-6 fatty acid desaturase (delta-12 desaturase)